MYSNNNHCTRFYRIRIYINPGHGGHDSNDRYIAATGFWESEGNLGKGLHLRDILDSMNAITKMSRTTNNTNDDLGLSVIAADANNFDADYMHSIHSNAYNGQSNYTLILFQGKDNAPTYPEAKVMGGYLADEIFKAHRTSTKYNRGDADFYGTGQPYLGVFKGLTMPGTLSEGSFHDYIPESFRLKNDAYLDHEAWAITKAFIKYLI
ncbi:MAG: N-acetylmuramoyl-L-alanine amidase [Ignavibacteriales bacterium]|nr:N-acetylmuramoyl-L-alanine amidase [Ignavibacteriales bacterium]